MNGKMLRIYVFVVWCFCGFAAAHPNLVLNDLGCWRDQSQRAIPDVDSSLDGAYKSRSHAVQQCARLAHSNGYSVFGVQDGGWCATGPSARDTYKKYGPATNCGADGKGGAWANQVYEINRVYQVDFIYVGCYRDTSTRAIQPLEGRFNDLRDTYSSRSDPINKCARAAASSGSRLFAIQHGGWCASSPGAEMTYDKYGPSTECGSDGEGGPWANAVYEIIGGRVITLNNLGCYKDTSSRAITTLEGTGGFLDGSNYQSRSDAIGKCARQASSFGYDIMALQHGGWCASSRDAGQTYAKYGKTDSCGYNGKGGPWGNEVYHMKVQSILKVSDMGCWADDSFRTIRSAESATEQLKDAYRSRKYAIEKCADYANSMGYSFFAVQYGGWCATANDAGDTYTRLGSSAVCDANGKGGGWSNQVYKIIEHVPGQARINKGDRLLIPYH